MRGLYIFTVLTLCFALCLCGDHPDGESSVSRAQDDLGNYHFSYSVANSEGEQFREEGTDALGRVVGSYGLKHIDGTHRVVDYVADKDGFRAAVRSNEPGVVSAEAADASIVKTDQNVPLSVSATSDHRSRETFGRRLDIGASKVAYANEDDSAKVNEEKEESVRESRQQNFDDYRPRSPVAYYPTDTRSPLNPLPRKPVDQGRSPRVLSHDTEADSKPLDVYFPPINPHTAIRRPAYYLPRERSTDGNFYSTTSRKPYIPPYGGFDDDPLPPLDKSPGLSHHSGFGPDRLLPTPTPPSPYGVRRFPSVSTPEHRNIDLPRFPPSSGFPRSHGSILPSVPRSIPEGAMFNPPSYDGRVAPPNFVLRAVPIPNGIQAVRVDPTTGRVYERLVYPLFLRHDGYPEYDRNILLHNDEISDDDEIRHDDPGYLDMPYLRRPYRGARNQPSDDDDDNNFRNRRYNRNYTIDESSLSEPSAADLAWVERQLSLVEGFDRENLPNSIFPNRVMYHDSDFPRVGHFNDENRQEYERRIQSSRIRPNPDLLTYSSGEDLSRVSRSHEELKADTSEIISSKQPDGNSTLREAHENKTNIEKEGS